MDPISTALTVAWLDAVRRLQSEALAAERSLVPPVADTGPPETLTAAIEGALRSGGAGADPGRPSTSAGLVNRLA